jgi:hypothetical protein
MAELKSLRKDIAPLVKLYPKIKDVVDIFAAIEVGGKGVKWIASIATALLVLGGAILAVRAMWQGFWGTVP